MTSCFQAAAAEEALPDSISPGGKQLLLNGSGERTKFFLSLYDAGLYLQEKSSDAAAIIEADKAMAIRMHITSAMITSEKMEQATMEGFVKSTGGQTGPLAEEIDRFIDVFRAEITKGDIYDMVYVPGKGVTVTKNNKKAEEIAGLAFKKALFGIWLSTDPVQESLKKELLGN